MPTNSSQPHFLLLRCDVKNHLVHSRCEKDQVFMSRKMFDSKERLNGLWLVLIPWNATHDGVKVGKRYL